MNNKYIVYEVPMKKTNYLSLASVVSSFAVVMLHTNTCFWNFSKERYWITANIIETVMYFAVPVFFMLSGATLIDYRDRYTTKQYAIKRINKTVVPFFVWSVIAIIYLTLVGSWDLDFSIVGMIDSIKRILSMNVLSIYWFFGALFSVYLCIPLFACVQKELRVKIFAYIVGISFFLNSFLPFICRLLNIDFSIGVSIPIAGGYIMYVLLGYILHKVEVPGRFKKIIYILAAIGLFIHTVGTQYLSFQAGTIIQIFKGYLNVPCVLYSVGVFLAFKDIGRCISNEKVLSIIDTISKYTFAVYLLHWFVINMLVRVFNINTYSIIYRIIGPVIVYALCMMITYVIRKVPLINKIIP